MTKFIDATIAFQPKKSAKTIFTHYLDDTSKFVNINVPRPGSEYTNVMYLGKHTRNNVVMDLFKAWDVEFDTAHLYLGIKGNEEYKSM